MNELSIALQVAINSHAGQKDKGGFDYIWHPLSVALMCKSNNAKLAAILHDVVEDSPTSLNDLRDNGINEDVVFAVDCLTKRKGETIDEYQNRIILSDLAIEVKFADMLHNSDLTRLPDPVVSEENCLKYYKRMAMLLNKTGDKLRSLNANLFNEIVRVAN